MTKKLLSIAALTALLSTGASAFDMERNTGNIIADVTVSHKNAIYTDGVKADANLTLSKDRRGDALIYPAFRSGDEWSTEISVRNTKEVAIIAKAVIYAKDNSRELGDFNLYLSPHDAAKFTIKDGIVTSSDGSIASKVVDPYAGLLTPKADNAVFANEELFSMPLLDPTVDAGYVIIYSMTEQVNNPAKNSVYHKNHINLFKDYRKMLDVCRESDTNTSTAAEWRQTFTRAKSSRVTNGTAIDVNHVFKAPNLDSNCTTANASSFVGDWKLAADFTTPSSDALFGEVTMSHGGEDKRSLIIPATALENYTTDNQIMLWTEGEYAAIQDRQIEGANYDVDGIANDANTFVINHAYFTFDAHADKCKNEYAFLLTQPMKRALVMAGRGKYWTNQNPNANEWGLFRLNKTPWTDDEGKVADGEIGYIQLNSPLEGITVNPAAYYDEVATFDYKAMVNEIEEDLDTYGFKEGAIAGYIDMLVNEDHHGLPAIVSQMTSNDVEGEAQINWIYSATSND